MSKIEQIQCDDCGKQIALVTTGRPLSQWIRFEVAPRFGNYSIVGEMVTALSPEGRDFCNLRCALRWMLTTPELASIARAELSAQPDAVDLGGDVAGAGVLDHLGDLKDEAVAGIEGGAGDRENDVGGDGRDGGR